MAIIKVINKPRKIIEPKEKWTVFSSSKQIRLCESIRDTLGLPIRNKAFENMTRWQASQFISEHIEEYKEYQWGDDRTGPNIIETPFGDYDFQEIFDYEPCWGDNY